MMVLGLWELVRGVAGSQEAGGWGCRRQSSCAGSKTHTTIVAPTHLASLIQSSTESQVTDLRLVIHILILTSESRVSRKKDLSGFKSSHEAAGLERQSFLGCSGGCLPERRHSAGSCPNRLVGVPSVAATCLLLPREEVEGVRSCAENV